MMLDLSVGESDLLLEALKRAASRHTSEAKFRPNVAGPHDRKAIAMLKLALRIKKEKEKL